MFAFYNLANHLPDAFYLQLLHKIASYSNAASPQKNAPQQVNSSEMHFDQLCHPTTACSVLGDPTDTCRVYDPTTNCSVYNQSQYYSSCFM